MIIWTTGRRNKRLTPVYTLMPTERHTEARKPRSNAIQRALLLIAVLVLYAFVLQPYIDAVVPWHLLGIGGSK